MHTKRVSPFKPEAGVVGFSINVQLDVYLTACATFKGRLETSAFGGQKDCMRVIVVA
jgi:hypothetical protein